MKRHHPIEKYIERTVYSGAWITRAGASLDDWILYRMEPESLSHPFPCLVTRVEDTWPEEPIPTAWVIV